MDLIVSIDQGNPTSDFTNLYRYNNFNMAAHHILAAPLGHSGSGGRGQCSSSLIFLLLLSFFFRCLFLLVTGQAIDSPYVFIALTVIYHLLVDS